MNLFSSPIQFFVSDWISWFGLPFIWYCLSWSSKRLISYSVTNRIWKSIRDKISIGDDKFSLKFYVSDWMFCLGLNFLLWIDFHMVVVTVNKWDFVLSTVKISNQSRCETKKINCRQKMLFAFFVTKWIFWFGIVFRTIKLTMKK